MTSTTPGLESGKIVIIMNLEYKTCSTFRLLRGLCAFQDCAIRISRDNGHLESFVCLKVFKLHSRVSYFCADCGGIFKQAAADADDGQKHAQKQVLPSEEKEKITIYGYEISPVGSALTRTFYVLTLGLLRLVFHWYPHWKLFSTHRKCGLDKATTVLIVVSNIVAEVGQVGATLPFFQDKYEDRHKSYFVENVSRLSVWNA